MGSEVASSEYISDITFAKYSFAWGLLIWRSREYSEIAMSTNPCMCCPIFETKYTCLKCWSEQTILHCEWFKCQCHGFCKFKTSQLKGNIKNYIFQSLTRKMNKVQDNSYDKLTWASLPRASISANTAALALGSLQSCPKFSYCTHISAENNKQNIKNRKRGFLFATNVRPSKINYKCWHNSKLLLYQFFFFCEWTTYLLK